MTHSEGSSRPNVLITSAARKVLLVRAFRDALARVGGGGRVLAADISPWAVAVWEADGTVALPRSDDPGFAESIERACDRDAIGLVVPTRDDELPMFAELRDRLARVGTTVLVSSPEAVAVCRDKVRFAAALAEAGFASPQIRAADDAPLPAFVKPRIGAGGHQSGVVRTHDELAAAMRAIRSAGGEPVIQERIDAPEYTVDAFFDLDGRAISCVPRERVKVVNGESVVSRTVDDPRLVEATVRLCTTLGLIGHVTVQAFRSDDQVVFIEINPRYGGAANLGFAAGAPTPEFAIRSAYGESIEPRLGDYEVGLVMLRYAEDRFIREAALTGDAGAR
jgi:carbamoyl-phosphate synthase large subunit